MNRFTSFLAGVVVGVIGLYGCMHFYVVHTNDGVEFVRKLNPQVSIPYVDVRKFTPADWQSHSALAAAMVKAGKTKALGGAAANSLGNSVSTAVDDWMNDQSWKK